MSHHAYFYAGEREAGIAKATDYAHDVMGLSSGNNPDLIIFRYGLFSVDDARRVIRLADQRAVGGDAKVLVLAAERLFHEAQNALLKLFEEPPPGTTLILIVPSAGILLKTLRSRMLPLAHGTMHISSEAEQYLSLKASEREKYISKLLDRTKSDKDEEKQTARGEALRLVEGLTTAVYEQWSKTGAIEYQEFLRDATRLIPVLHERSAPLKLIFEHLSLIIPKDLVR